MGLRLRKPDGSSLEVPFSTGCSVEICDQDGQIGAVVCQLPNGAVRLIDAGSPEAQEYARRYGVSFCPVKDITHKIGS